MFFAASFAEEFELVQDNEFRRSKPNRRFPSH
jgi:hypothetical protein